MASKTKNKAKSKAGPKGPRLMTPKLVNTLCRYIKRGNTEDDSARLALLKTATYWKWKAKGKRDLEDGVESEYADFVQRIDQAKAHLVDSQVGKVIDSTDWRSGAFFLERRQPDRWGKVEKHQHELSGPNGGAIQIESEARTLSVLVNDEIAAEALAVLAERAAALTLQGVNPKQIEGNNDKVGKDQEGP